MTILPQAGRFMDCLWPKKPSASAVTDVSPHTSIAQAKTKWLARQSASAPTFALSEGDASVPSR